MKRGATESEIPAKRAKSAHASFEIADERLLKTISAVEEVALTVRNMLTSALPGALQALRCGERHTYAVRLVNMAQEILSSEDKRLVGEVTRLQNKVSQLDEEQEAAEDDLAKAREELLSGTKAVQHAQEELEDATSMVNDFLVKAQEAERSLKVIDSELGAAVMQREQLRRHSPYPEDEAYTGAEHVDALDAKISRLAIDRMSVTASIKAAHTERESGSLQRTTLEEKVATAKEELRHHKDAWQTAGRSAKQAKCKLDDASAEASKAEANLNQLRSGPLATLADALRSQKPFPVSPVANSSCALPTKMILSRSAEAVRRRRCSWLPRKMLALALAQRPRAAKDLEIMPQNTSPVSNLEAKHVVSGMLEPHQPQNMQQCERMSPTPEPIENCNATDLEADPETEEDGLNNESVIEQSFAQIPTPSRGTLRA